MNRKPQAADSWWKSHQAACNGTFIKVSEPEITKKEKADEDKLDKRPNLSNLSNFKGIGKGKGRTWSETQKSESSPKITEFFKKSVKSESEKVENELISKLKCVNCTKYETESLKELNEHLDVCLKKFVFDLTD